jgi:hypothetical protein
MVKFLTTFRLKPGFDREETFQLWKAEHVPKFVEMLKGTGARKYVIAKLLSAPEGGTEFFGMAEIWYDNLEDALKATQNSVARRDSAFTERITDMRRVYVLDEEEIELADGGAPRR